MADERSGVIRWAAFDQSNFGGSQTLYFGNPSICRGLCGAGEQDARGLVCLRDLNAIADERLWDDSIR